MEKGKNILQGWSSKWLMFDMSLFVLMKLSGCSSQQFLKTNTSMNSNVFLYLLTISHIIEKKKSHTCMHIHTKKIRGGGGEGI